MVVYALKKTPSEDSNDRDVISPPSASSQPDIPTEAAPSSPKVVTATTAPPLSFKETYTLGKRLGAGAFAVVREGVNKVTGTKFAVKCIKTSSLSPADVRGLRQEISILKQLSHPNIMSLHDVVEEPNVTYLVTEYIAGGELFDRIVEKTFYSENEARELVRILLGAIKYCHDHNVVHRDLKQSIDGLTTACGTPGYVAPEIIKGEPYGKSVDIWSVGVITYILLCGYPPFHDDNPTRLFAAIKTGSYKFESPYWDDVSADAKAFIGCMLKVHASSRATADELLKHAWMVNMDVSTAPLGTVLEELKKYNHRRKFKAAVRTEYYSENEARALVRLVLQAIKHCHDHDIVHRDLKPENIFLASASDNTSVKIGDFGYAVVAAESTLTTACGTPSYVAPEILLHEPYGKPVDVWSVGVITYILLVGYMPFHGNTQVELFSRIKHAEYDCPDDLSPDAQDFLSKMLVVAPVERYTVDQLLCHVWITGTVVPTFPLTKTREELRKFNLRRKIRAGVRAVQAMDTFSKLPKIHLDDEYDDDARGMPREGDEGDGTVPPTTPTDSASRPKPGILAQLPSARSWFRSMRVHPTIS
ncbi:hypothetical protein DYB37_008609 [Aphanomyces astaci]|uniref:Protein kinase domain-containing protein n=2 Tax=Aphanomyces astaci TaxID=112090 RepID=A0A3R7AD32_APHAT|nr:hypothetical protein DYB37_008609 [Aphanomyces astaci]